MKKFLSILLVIAMLCSVALLSACGTKKEEKKPAADSGVTVDFEPGTPPTFKYLYNTSEGHKAIGEYLQAALQTVGINMTLENQEWATFLNTRKAGDFTIARNGWVADYTDPICFLDMWTTNSGNNDVQFGKGAHASLAMYDLDLTAEGYDIKVEDGTWADTYDVLISTIKGCTDEEVRYALMHKAEDMLMDTGCIIPIYYYTDLYMIDDEVDGFFSSPLGYKYFTSTTYKDNSSISACLASEPDTIDPALNSAVDGATMLVHLFSGLAKWAQGADGKLEIVADCAEELVDGVENEDGTVTYTYTLKDGLKWSDGKDLTAKDFEFAWKRAASVELAADYGYMFEVIDGYADVWDVDDEGNAKNPDAELNVKAIDDKTLEVTLASAISYWNELLAFPTYFPVREDVVKDESWATDPSTYVCNGAYTIADWNHNSVITLKKNDSYYDAANVTMKEIKLYLSDDANNMLTNFKNGDWQLIDDVPTNEIASLKADYPDEFVVAGQIGTYYVCWNINAEVLPDTSDLEGVEAELARQEIRKAIGLLFDRNYICESIAQGGQVPASSFVAMGMVNPDGTQFYQTAGDPDANGYPGYYDVSKDSFEATAKAAFETLQKYYAISIAE